jgi:RNA polymerase sigma-70 factor (ECF subfamily)
VAQQAFAQLLVHWKKVSRYDMPKPGSVESRSASRHEQPAEIASGDLASAVETPEPAPSPDLDLVRALKALPQQRGASRCSISNRPVKEIADILSCSESTAKAHLFKARGKLAQLLREDEGEALDAT